MIAEGEGSGSVNVTVAGNNVFSSNLLLTFVESDLSEALG
jgi:hypothetical protein